MILVLLVISHVPQFCFALFEINDNTFEIQVSQTITISSPFYPNFTYSPGSSGRYIFIAPNGYQVQVQCNFNIPKVRFIYLILMPHTIYIFFLFIYKLYLGIKSV